VGGTVRLIEEFNSGKFRRLDKDSPIYHLYEAVSCFRDFVDGLSEKEKKEFLEYLFKNVYFVKIVTNSQSSAFRLFNVLNTRGLPLSAADILKSMNLESVPDEKRREYFRMWRDAENDIGREELENVISYVRTIYREEKAKKELVDEFEKIFKDKLLKKGVEFFDVTLRFVDIYRNKIREPKLETIYAEKRARYETLIHLMKRFLPFSEWIPPLLLFADRFRGSDDALYQFAFQIERKFFIEWCADFTTTERTTSSINLIRLIKSSQSPKEVLDVIFRRPEKIRRGRQSRRIDFTDENAVKEILLSKLDDEKFYTLKGGKMARYLLLRLDMEMQEENFPGYVNIATITVEHILPRTPQGRWLEIFSPSEIEKIVDKLGNLALLNKYRNSKASNYEFEKKKEKYFEVKRNPFAITTMLRDYDKWDMKSFERRHKELLNLALKIYLPKL